MFNPAIGNWQMPAAQWAMGNLQRKNGTYRRTAVRLYIPFLIFKFSNPQIFKS
jgi:hypothetical protein